MKNILRFKEAGMMVLLACLTAAVATGAGSTTTDLNAPSLFNQQIQQSIQMQTRVESALINSLQQSVEQFSIQKKIEQEIVPNLLVPEFLKFYTHHKSEINTELNKRLGKRSATASGEITGTVTVQGAVPEHPVDIFIFDSHGFFVTSDTVSLQDGSYVISALPSDSFYIVTQSNFYVDEIYKNIQDPLHSMQAWQSAQRVPVSENTVNNIDFDLDTGAHISGNIYDENENPVTDVIGDFTLVDAISGKVLRYYSLEITGGSFQLPVPITGQFKLKVSVPGYLDTWAASAVSRDQAAILTVNTLDEEVTIDIQLLPFEQVKETGAVSGSIGNAFLALTLAFDTEDHSVAGFGIGFLGAYSIENLPPGNYYIYGNDYLSGALGGPNFAGKFYDGALGSFSITGAQPVTVLPDTTLEEISMQLEAGGSIMGKVTNSQGIPVDSMLLTAIRTDLMQQDSIPFPADIDIIPAITAQDGSYHITGLASGKYIIRTISEYKIIIDNIFAAIDSSDLGKLIGDGKHKGQVVDAWYGDIYNLLSIGKAERIHVTAPNTTENIDIHLESPHYISGSLSDAVDTRSVHGAWIIAMTADVPLPYIRYVSPNQGTSYRLGPLPPEPVKVAAFVNPLQNDTHLSEFYSNVRSFEEAMTINLTDSVTTGIDFSLERGATVQGFVHLQSDDGAVPAGVDTLENTQVIAFDSESGSPAMYNQAQFNSGFRLRRLTPGTYKIMALPTQKSFSAVYYGGGTHFDHDQTQTLTVQQGEIHEITLTIPHSTGIIRGRIHDAESGDPLSHIGVAAYDPSGHASALTVTKEDGSYSLEGLQAGDYHIRTISLAALLQIEDIIESLLSDLNMDDPLALLNGGLPSLSGLSNLWPHEDMWYPEVPAVQNIILDELAFRLLAYGIPHWTEAGIAPIYLPIPFYVRTPAEAQIVTLGQGETKTDINFNLAAGIPVTDVNESETLPETFALQQNVPNPFNPSTRISFSTPRAGNVTLKLYDVLGRHVRTLTEGYRIAGEHTVVWNGRDTNDRSVSAGVYFAQIRFAESQKTIKMMLIK